MTKQERDDFINGLSEAEFWELAEVLLNQIKPVETTKPVTPSTLERFTPNDR